jgi:hypothetical protein
VGETVSMQIEQPARLPQGVQKEDIVAQCLVEYRGGHPNQTDADSGYLYLTKVGLFFVAAQPTLDITIAAKQILDISAPMVGTFSSEMISRAEQAQAVSGMGRHLTSFAGALVGGVGGAAIRAIGNSASGVAASKNSLGPPPKNRLYVIAVEGGAKHKVIFDVMASDKNEMEQQAASFWRKTASVRSAFASVGKVSPKVAPAMNVSASSVQAEFFISKAGLTSGPFTDASIRQMLVNGELNNNDLIRVETWVPISVINLFNSNKPNTEGNATPTAFQAAIPQSHQPLSENAIRTDGVSHKSSATPMIAAGVGGIVAGAAIASLMTPGTAQASSVNSQASPNQGHGIQGIVLDTNQDGMVDTAGIDSDHDGQIDAIGVDVDGDGEVDAVGLDIDHDGNLEAYGLDTDHDGQLDTYGFDSDGDGQVDVIGHDYEQDDQIDDFDSDDMDF